MKITKNLYRWLGLFKIGGICFVLSIFIVTTKYVSYVSFISIEFLFTFIAVLIGFGLTFFTHVIGLIEKLKDRYSTIKNENERVNKVNILMNIYSEMKDDIYFMFYSLIVVIATKIFSGFVVLVCIKYSIDNSFCNWMHYIRDAFLLSIFMLCLLSIKDLIAIAFKLSEHTIIKD